MPLVCILDRPATPALTIAVIALLAGWAGSFWLGWWLRPPSPIPGPPIRPPALDGIGQEPPAVVGLLTNDYRVPASAITATALDLAARGWVRLTTTDGELVIVTTGSGVGGETLRPFEHQVLNHLAARAFNGVTSASTLAASHHRLNRRWRFRFDRSVAATSQQLGLSRARYSVGFLAIPAVLSLIALVSLWSSIRNGTEIAIADSWRSRTLWFLATIVGLALVAQTTQRVLGADQTPTEAGRTRTDLWLGYRARLRDRIPEHASVVAPPPQQRALAVAVVMGLSPDIEHQLPAAPSDARNAWSEAGDRAHSVRIHYPVRPGYGQHPLKVLGVGLIVFLAARWIRDFMLRVGDGDALRDLLAKSPGQIDLFRDLADGVAVILILPMVIAVWAVVAGAIDTVATRERTGFVVRARHPVEVLPYRVMRILKPFAERSGYSTYLAVDDGKRAVVFAWLATERTAAPQGAQARVRATPMLGYVRSSEPIGTATRSA